MRQKDGPLRGKVVLVTGGTGSFGRAFVRTALREGFPKKLIVFSRDEWKQSQMQREFKDAPLRFFLGDIRDLARLERAFDGVDIVIHAAALKQVPTLEYNPFEAVQTNVLGAQNIINAAIDRKVDRVVGLSTDKAVNPINLYGATKLCAEKLFVAGNSYAGSHPTRFSIVRYGNVVGSRGSVIPLFLESRKNGVLPITDKRMTRFWITLEDSVRLVLTALEKMQGGEIFVPKIASMRVVDLARAVAPGCRLKEVGIRPGEKVHEVLITEDEAPRTSDGGNLYVIYPAFPEWGRVRATHRRVPPKGFRYSSDNNTRWLSPQELAGMVKALPMP